MYVTVQFLLFFILDLRAISKYKPLGAYIWRSDLTAGFLRCKFGVLYLDGLIHGGGLFSELYSTAVCPCPPVLFFQISL